MQNSRTTVGNRYEALKTIYKVANATLLTNGASVWEEALQKKKNINILQRSQCLMNIKYQKSTAQYPIEHPAIMQDSSSFALKLMKQQKHTK